MEVLSFEVTGKPVAESNTFILVNSVGTARRLEVRQKLGGEGSLELPHSIGYAMPRVIRSSEETRLVRFLKEPVD